MKIGFDAKRAFRNKTGLGNYSRNLIQNLNKFFPEIEVTLFTPKTEIGNGIDCNFQLKSKVVSPKKSILSFLWRSKTISQNTDFQKLDIYHGLSNELPFFSKQKPKKVVTIHDLIFLVYPEYYPRWDRFVYNLKSKYACKTADKIIAVSETTKQDIIRFYGIDADKIEVIYQNCDHQFHGNSNKMDTEILKKYSLSKDYIICVGTIEKRKNQLTLIEAFSESSISKNLDLVILGNGKEYLKEILNSSSYLKNKDKIHIISNFDFKDLPYLYKNALFSVYPSIYEGFGIPIIESYYSGTPVITHNQSCLPETAGNAALLCNCESVVELKMALEKMAFDAEFRSEKIREIPNQLLKFDEERNTIKLVNLYKSIL